MSRDSDIQKQLEHLNRFGVHNKDSESPTQPIHRSKKRIKTHKKNIIETTVDSEIDLHGLTLEEAKATIELEIECLIKSGRDKLRIIHGGNMKRRVPMRRTVEQLLQGPLKKHVLKTYRDHYNFGSIIAVLKS
ncbi:MAG: Smr/MutS family protein [Fibrobacterales bacterium]